MHQSPQPAGNETPPRVETDAAQVPDQAPAPGLKDAYAPGRPFVAAVGASAGGLKALVEFFSNTPAGLGVGWLVVTHQQAGKASLLPELIGKQTALPVVRVKAGVRLVADHIYMPPPGSSLGITDGVLHVLKPSPAARPAQVVDLCFRSLAEDQGRRAIGVVLSGTGSDGTDGIKAIKRAGGLTLAQKEDDAGYPGMPASAAATGLVDLVLLAGDMPERIATHVNGAQTCPPPYTDELADPEFERILLHLHQRTGYDFSLYKISTMRRRIQRRLQVHELADLSQYLLLVRTRPEELDELFQEVLIGVTSFFRDPAAFEALAATASARALAHDQPKASLRVWVAGCSTGEEAYSLAILLMEVLESADVQTDGLQIFATDLNPRSIDVARRGRYPAAIASSVSPERLERWFQRNGDDYQVAKAVRERVIFAVQNVHGDPPFTRLDLLACRNLLIYMQPELQQRLLPVFHYALKPDGILFLGSSESIHMFEHLFEPTDKRWKIYRRSAEPRPSLPRLGPRQPIVRLPSPDSAPHACIGRAADALLLATLTPASVFVDAEGNVMHSRGRIGNFLEPNQGRPSLNVISMAREGLGPDLAAAIRQAAGDCDEQRRVVRVRTNGTWSLVEFTVTPVDRQGIGELFLVRLTILEQPTPAEACEGEFPGQQELELQLVRTRQSLQSTVEQLEISNEELSSTNEELQSSNEEQQSSNEELETSREELQSLNEELQMVNAELADKLTQLSCAHDDMANLLNSTEVATLFLDDQLRIKRFTPQVKRLFQLIDTDVGRPITDQATRLCYEGLEADAREVLRTLVPIELEIPSVEGVHYLIRLSPYHTADNRLDGLVVTFIDTTPIQGTRQFTDRLLSYVPHPLAVLDDSCSVVLANRAFGEFLALSEREVYRRSVEQVFPTLGPKLRIALEQLEPDQQIEPCAVVSRVPGVGDLSFHVEAQRVSGGKLGVYVLTIIIDAASPPDGGEG